MQTLQLKVRANVMKHKEASIFTRLNLKGGLAGG